MQLRPFVRRSIGVSAIQVDAQNIDELSEEMLGIKDEHQGMWFVLEEDRAVLYVDEEFHRTFSEIRQQKLSRSAESGRFVTHSEAEANPSTTVTES